MNKGGSFYVATPIAVLHYDGMLFRTPTRKREKYRSTTVPGGRMHIIVVVLCA